MTTETHHLAALEGRAIAPGAAAAIDRVTELARQGTHHEPVELLDGVQAHIVPDGHTQVITDVRPAERENPNPGRRRGTAEFGELDPFVRYVNQHADPNATTVWTAAEAGRKGANGSAVGSIVAIIDDHSIGTAAAATPGWGEHGATLPLITTTLWQHWVQHDRKFLPHVEFAEHLETGIVAIVEPAAADFLDLAREIQVKRNVDFKSAARAGGGINVAYAEQEDATSGDRGELNITTSSFRLALRAFPGGAPMDLKGSLRWRLSDGNLSLGYVLDDPAEVLREAVASLHADLTEKLDESLRERVYQGSPISPRQRGGQRTEVFIQRTDGTRH